MNKEQRKEYMKAYRKANAERISKVRRNYYLTNETTPEAKAKVSQYQKGRRKRLTAEKYAQDDN